MYSSKLLAIILLLLGNLAQAQFLPNNAALNVQSVQRWMASNRDFKGVLEILDPMHSTETDLKKFEALSPPDQDKKINDFLREKKTLETATSIAVQHGWKSVGEYMRLSTKLGNAIAAYFLVEETKNLTATQKKQVHEKTDASVLAVPTEDIAFVNKNEKLLKSYIQAYAQGR
jgi:hypothetical protein